MHGLIAPWISDPLLCFLFLRPFRLFWPHCWVYWLTTWGWECFLFSGLAYLILAIFKDGFLEWHASNAPAQTRMIRDHPGSSGYGPFMIPVGPWSQKDPKWSFALIWVLWCMTCIDLAQILKYLIFSHDPIYIPKWSRLVQHPRWSENDPKWSNALFM